MWSPDGTKFAGLQDRYPLGPQLFVINADGSGDHTIAESESVGGLEVGGWSPDGSRLAYYADGSIFTVSAAGGDARFLTSDARNLAPAWSPDGALLAYTSSDFFVSVIRPDGSDRRRLGDGYDPVWSPSGESLLFVRDQHAWVIGRDGSDLHELADLAVTGNPAWSADGQQILFTGLREHTSTGNVFVVNADGSDLRQLTRFAPDPSQGGAYNAVSSPDGDQILFSTYNRLLRMNFDGSCVDTVVADQALGGWAWQPVPSGPPMGERSCSAVGLDYQLTYGNRGLAILVTVHNEGTEPLSDARLVASTDNGLDLDQPVPSSGYCETHRHRVSCAAHLDRGESYTVALLAKPRWYSRIPTNRRIAKVGLRATAPGTLLPTGRETQDVSATVVGCSTQDPGGGRIDGWFLADHICGRTGGDLIHPGDGRDVVEAGAGNDVIYANHDHWSRDRIFCGRGRDVVAADPRDRVAKDCEQVVRR